MNVKELKMLLIELAEDEPDFMRDLIGEVIRANLSIDRAATWECTPTTAIALRWQSDSYNDEFSRAY